MIQWAASRGQDPGASIDLLQAQGSGASEDELVIGRAEGVIGGILSEGAAIIRLRADIAGCGETIESKVLAFGAFERIIALVADESKAGTANVGRQGKQTEFGR